MKSVGELVEMKWKELLEYYQGNCSDTLVVSADIYSLE